MSHQKDIKCRNYMKNQVGILDVKSITEMKNHWRGLNRFEAGERISEV